MVGLFGQLGMCFGTASDKSKPVGCFSSIHGMRNLQANWLARWLIYWVCKQETLTNWLTDWLTGWLADWLTDWAKKLSAWASAQTSEWVTEWLSKQATRTPFCFWWIKVLKPLSITLVLYILQPLTWFVSHCLLYFIHNFCVSILTRNISKRVIKWIPVDECISLWWGMGMNKHIEALTV